MLNGAYDLVLRLPRFRGKSRIASFLRRQLAPKPSTIVHGLRMELDPAEWPQVDLRAFGRLEPETTALFERLLKQGDIYVDVGAHVGYHALVARHCVGASGRVLAIDPQPYNCDKLLTNAGLNGFTNITVVVAAAGRADGSISLRNQSRSDRSRLTLNGAGVNDEPTAFVVPMLRLDSLFAAQRLDRVDLMKVDVEGCELDVLLGAGDSLDRVKNIVVEILPEATAEKANETARLLRASGYLLSDVEGADWQPGRTCVENNVWARRP